jgi:hypothetical protein
MRSISASLSGLIVMTVAGGARRKKTPEADAAGASVWLHHEDH